MNNFDVSPGLPKTPSWIRHCRTVHQNDANNEFYRMSVYLTVVAILVAPYY